MLRTRIIPVLLLRNKGLVKTVKFDKHKYIGDPINAIRIFNDKEVDELVFLDIDASKQKRKPDFELVAKIAAECFMPLGYGGGISDIDDIKTLFSIGVEKVILNSSALKDLSLVRKAADIFGDQSIVVSIDIKKNFLGKYTIYSHSNISHRHSDVTEYVKAAATSGAGEIILNSVDLDGMMTGYDLKLIEKISHSITIPVVACGGAGNPDHMRKAFDAGASALAAGSMFVYHGPHKAVLINYPSTATLKTLFS